MIFALANYLINLNIKFMIIMLTEYIPDKEKNKIWLPFSAVWIWQTSKYLH